MVKQLVLLTALILCCAAPVRAQTTDDSRPLFTVNAKPVTVGEFVYIYSKTNGENATFSEASLKEYLDLYTKFKLKVARAREMQLDTIVVLQDELAGYRSQLADSYLTDRAITDPLTLELYNRIQRDVDLSHILIPVKSEPTPADTLDAYRRILSVKTQIEAGKYDFASAAAEYSADRYSAERAGRVGFLTAPLPKGLYNLETVAYTAEPGQLVGPVRTNLGYHLVQVNGSRPARGEIEAGHILIRTEGRPEGEAIARIDSIYQALEGGADFRALAARVSEDNRTASQGGYIGFFGINRFEPAFEEAAFALEDDGDYTQPVRSQVGFHIIQRISRKGIQPFALERPQLERKVKEDTRFEIAQQQMLDRIKVRANFRERQPPLTEFVASLTDTFRNFRWKAPEPSPRVLFEMDGGFQATLGDFTDWIGNKSRERLAVARSRTAEETARQLYADFVDEQLMRYEEGQLEKNYPDFAALMREYEEGILLFEATKMEVWDKASQDSVGLAKFFAQHREDYRWDERAQTTVFLVGLKYEDQLPAIRAFAMKNDPEAVRKQFNTEGRTVVSLDQATYEQDRIPELRNAAWKVGTVTEATTNRSSGGATFYKIEAILPPARKELDEARGYVIADYQDQLEKDWIQELSERFKVKVNKKVFESLIAE